MALDASLSDILSSLLQSVSAGVAGNWIATPVPERLAILAREELIRWVRGTYPAAALENEDSDSLRRLAVRIYTPRDCHRVEIHGAPCGVDVMPSELAACSWVFVAHLCVGCERNGASLAAAGLKKVDETSRPAGNATLVLSLWMGPRAPEGCPSCLPVPKDIV